MVEYIDSLSICYTSICHVYVKIFALNIDEHNRYLQNIKLEELIKALNYKLFHNKC